MLNIGAVQKCAATMTRLIEERKRALPHNFVVLADADSQEEIEEEADDEGDRDNDIDDPGLKLRISAIDISSFGVAVRSFYRYGDDDEVEYPKKR